MENILKDALDAMGEAIAIWDENDRLIYCNDRYKTFFELSNRVRLGVKFEELIDAHIDSNDVLSLDGVNVKNRPQTYKKMRYNYHKKCEGIFIDQSTKGQWRQIKERKFNGNMRVGIYTDITEQKRVEYLLTKAKNDLEIANQVKSNFLANISHELKTPLHAILSYAQLIKENKNNFEYNISSVISSSEYLTSMIDDMLEKTKLDISDNKISKKSIYLSNLIDEISRMFTVIANNKNIEFIIKEKNLPNIIESDERKIKQILINLIGNAIKFTQKGRVVLKIKGIDGGIKFIVEDSGIGISKTNFEKIFNPFEKLDNTLNTKGIGLGLAISNEYAKLLYRGIKIKSKINKGSTFSFIVPNDSKLESKKIKKNRIDVNKTNKIEFDTKKIDEEILLRIKECINKLYFYELEEIFKDFDAEVKQKLQKLLKSYDWEALAKVFA